MRAKTEMKKPRSLGSISGDQSYCTTAEAARSLGVSIRTIQLWVDGGVLAAWKTVGGHRRITLDSLARLRNSSGMEEETVEVEEAKQA